MIKIAEIKKLAKTLGLIRGKGTYNGAAYWTRPSSSAILTAEDVLDLAGYGVVNEQPQGLQ